MKMKRFLSLLLALVMSLSLFGTAFAAEPDGGNGDPNEGIMPLSVTLYKNEYIDEKTNNNYTTNRFTSTPGYGPYIKAWFRNDSASTVNVYLWRTDRTSYVKSMRIESGESDEMWYFGSNTTSVTYYVTVSTVNSYPVKGYLSVAQKLSMQD